LENAIRPYVQTGRAAGQSPDDGGRLDETNPVVASTLDRLELTRAVLAEHLDRPTTPAPTTPTPTEAPSDSTPEREAAPAVGTEPADAADDEDAAAKRHARLVGAPRVHGGTIRFTIRCLSGTCRLGATVVAGTRTLGRLPAFTLRAGRQQTVTVHLNRSGRRLLADRGRLRARLRVTLGDSPLAQTALTLRR
jgi:hypothetical protein